MVMKCMITTSSQRCLMMLGIVQLPDEICGDLDSLRAEVAAFYRARGVHIVHKPSQYATDFAKCVDRIKSFQQHGKQVEAGGITAPSKPLDIVVLGGLGGRVDQGFAVMHQLCVLAEDDQAPGIKDIVLYSDRSVSFVLQPGCNRITTPLTEGYLTENVGIIPLGRAAVISTDGLEWDVQDWPAEFGKQVSTSNHIKKDTVSVIVDVNVLFTVELSETLPLEKVE
ncbi:MAG: hypothetical protein M1815_002765 [Lichina confinis]|nr:MAG: hypothetical protein M1815_002765 [Lichina confinis]